MPDPVFSGTVMHGQIVTISAGQTGSSIVVQTGGTLVVDPGGTVDDLQVNFGGVVVDGGQITLVSGNVASGVDVESGGVIDVTSGATVDDTIVESGGEEIVTDYLYSQYGRAQVDEEGVANDTNITSGSIIEIAGFPYSTDNDLFADVDASELTAETGSTMYYTYHHSQTITGAQPGYFVTSGPGDSIYDVRLQIACYLSGAAIATGQGDRPVESVAPGDFVTTASGQERRVRWVGRRSYAGRFLAANPGVQPVRFRAGALGGGLPRRDLLVSPEHAMFLDGVLVPARLLVNGTTVVQERGLARVDYVHLELDSHDLLLAEGAPSETFVDDGTRFTFQNAPEWQRSDPGRARVPPVFCARRVTAGPELEAIRRHLARLASPAAHSA